VAADVAPIRPEERFDEGRVAAYLREHLASIGDWVIFFAQFPGGGPTSPTSSGRGTWSWCCAGPRWGR